MNQLIIETKRLIIRAYKESDLQEAYELMQEQDLFTYLPMEVMPFEQYRELFNWLISCYDGSPNHDWFKYSFVITRKQDDRQIGWCGIGSLDFNHKDKEVFYLIGKPYWGNGYATEALRGLIQFCFAELGLLELVAVVKAGNVPSQKVLEKLGFEYHHEVTGLSEEFDFYNGELYYTLRKQS